ncbi:MAG TPA: 4-carboxymuconolactone decarboxylase [Gaiellaceae bacterium]|nr:4-carboxymuconolactone decarboxylase [Gaiellaceae bacterium]
MSDYDRGLEIRRAVLGDEHVDRSLERATELTFPFQELITRYAWGDVWSRPGLDRRTRSVVTMTALVALGRFDELELHIRGAMRNGLEPEEIAEVLLQCTIYCGVPAANSAFHAFERVFSDDA